MRGRFYQIIFWKFYLWEKVILTYLRKAYLICIESTQLSPTQNSYYTNLRKIIIFVKLNFRIWYWYNSSGCNFCKSSPLEGNKAKERKAIKLPFNNMFQPVQTYATYARPITIQIMPIPNRVDLVWPHLTLVDQGCPLTVIFVAINGWSLYILNWTENVNKLSKMC